MLDLAGAFKIEFQPSMRINALRVRLYFVIGIAVLLTGRFLPCQSLPESRVVHLDKPFVQSTIDSLTQVIRQEYVDADVASRVETYLRKRLAEGRYQLPTGDAVAQVLTQDLFDSSHDKHLFVTVSPDAANATAVIAQEPSRKETARFSNFGIQRVEILSGNIGYLNLTSFYRLEEARESFVSAMQVLAHADALVLDLRGNKGG